MKNIVCDDYRGPRLPREVQLRRLKNVIQCELTPRQRYIYESIRLEGRTMVSLAKELGRNKSSISRAFHRAERIVRMHLRY